MFHNLCMSYDLSFLLKLFCTSLKVLPKKEVTTDESQKEFVQQNGLNELKTVPVSNDSVADSVLPDAESSIKDSNVVLEAKDEVQPEISIASEINEESG